jgi:membrane associated rhomboid family serine protease
MSYFAGKNDEAADNLYKDDLVESNRSPRSSKGRKSSRSSKKGGMTVEEYQENNAVGNFAEPVVSESEDERRNRRSSGKDSRRRSKSRHADEEEAAPTKLRALGSGEVKRGLFGRSSKRSKSRNKKSRHDRVYDDVLGSTNYQEVDDGIVGCADELCVNKEACFDEEPVQSNKDPSGEGPNTGEQNKNMAESEEIYIVKQRFGYFSIFFAIIQVIVLGLMMWQCGVAPLNINPMFGPYPDAFSEWGGKNSILIVDDGEWWRLLTPILLHAGLIHLFCNVAVQLELGVFFEREWGSMTWLIIYLTSAVGSSVLSVITMPDAVSVGSSGAVMGLFGGKIAEIICRCCEKKTTAQDRVAHQVRKEQCMGVTCSVVVVLAFSFIPYGTFTCTLP